MAHPHDNTRHQMRGTETAPRWAAALVLIAAAAVAGCGSTAATRSTPTTTTTSTTSTTVPVCEADPYLEGCPLYEPPTTTTLPPPITAPPLSVYNLSQPSYDDQLQQCEEQNYAQAAMIANQVSQETLGRNATPAEVQQIVAQQCQRG